MTSSDISYAVFLLDFFVDTILLEEFQSRLLMFEETNFDHTRDGINLATETFTDLSNEISLRSLKLNCPKKALRRTTIKEMVQPRMFPIEEDFDRTI